MSRRSPIPKSPRHIYVYDEDWEWLTSRYTGVPIGTGAACCEIIHNRVKIMRQLEIDRREAASDEPTPSDEMESSGAD